MEILCKTLEELNTAVQNQDPELIITLDFPRENIIPELPHIHGSYQLIGSTIVGKATGNTRIKEMDDSSCLECLCDNSSVESMYHTSDVTRMSDKSHIKYMFHRSSVSSAFDNSSIFAMSAQSSVYNLFDKSVIQNMADYSKVMYLTGESSVISMFGYSSVVHMNSSSSIHNMYAKSRVENVGESRNIIYNMWENSSCWVYNSAAVVNAHQHTTVQSPLPLKKLANVSLASSATFVHQPSFKHTLDSLRQIHKGNLVDEETIRLYKVVKEDHTDFWTGTIKYEGIVECPDWDPNPERQCGGGLHLSPTPALALEYHPGKVLECHVKLEDIAVYPYDVINKLRCRKVEVVGELS